LPVVLVAFVLVLLAAATFAAGIAASRTSDTLVYLSIFFSVAAFVVLAIASLRARQAEREAADVEPLGTRTLDDTEAHAAPLVGGLDATQLDMTPSWQRRSRERWDTILEDDEDESLEEQLENEEDEADFEVPVVPVTAGRADEFHWAADDEVELEEEPPTAAFTPSFDEFDEFDVLDIPEPEPDAAADSFFDRYDDLTAAEIVPSLRDLDLVGLEWVRARERSGANRTTVLSQVERLIVDQGGRASQATTRKRTTAKKAAPARRAAKKSTRRR
jgi:hypothetical protein